MTKIRKGTEVWMFGSWDDQGTAYARRLVITSFGKEQGTAIYVENGENIQQRLYAKFHYANIVPVADLPDPTEYGLEFARKFIADRTAFHNEKMEWVRNRNAAGERCAWTDAQYAQVREEALAKLHEPRFVIA